MQITPTFSKIESKSRIDDSVFWTLGIGLGSDIVDLFRLCLLFEGSINVAFGSGQIRA
jgi:hypothetical protein